MKGKFIKKSEDCVLVKGHKNSIIYDFTRMDFFTVSQSEARWFEEIDKKPLDVVNQSTLKNKGYNDFVKHLYEQELVFDCSEEELAYFPSLETKWRHPSKISNLILFRSKESSLKIYELLDELEELGLLHVQFFLEDQLNFDQIKELIVRFSELPIKSIEVVSANDISEALIIGADDFIDTQLVSLTITNSKEFGIIKKSSEHPFDVLFLKNDFREIFRKNSPDPNYFKVDIRLFMESQFHNTFFNRKLIIDSRDNILDHPNGNVLGKLKSGTISELIELPEFTRLWNLKKDNINICKDCEYRHMCVDSRIPVNEQGEWKFNTACNYDPYLGKWK